jgi:hypothetical protein
MTHGGVSVSEHEINSYLEGRGNTNDSASPTLRLRVIGIDHAGKAPEEIAKRVEDIKHRLTSGSKFADVAIAYSDGPNKEQGGILGLIAEKDLHSEVFDAVFALDEGAFSKPVVTDTSTQIFYVEERFSSDEGDDDTSYKTLIKHGAYETGFALLDNFGLNSRGETVLLDFGELSFVKAVAVKHSPYQYGNSGSETVIVILGGGRGAFHHPVRVSLPNLSESSSALLPA